MLFELVEGFYVNPELVAVVRKTGINECALFTAGQSAVDGGHHLPFSVDEVVEALSDAEKELYGQEEEAEAESE